jgi:hypothetical protein
MNFLKYKIYINLILLTLITPIYQGCNSSIVANTSNGNSSSTDSNGQSSGGANVSGKAPSAACATISTQSPFNGGKGTVSEPYIICSPQQLLNISSVQFNESLQIEEPGFFDFPYMDKAFILGADISFVGATVEFFTLGHMMASIGRSKTLTDSQKQMIVFYDDMNTSTFVASLAQKRIPFNGILDGKSYGIEIGEYYPSESRMVGLFGLGAPGLVIKNLLIKNFQMFLHAGVNTGLLLGSYLESPVAEQWAKYNSPRSKKPGLIENVNIVNSSVMFAVANSGALVGAAKVYPEQELTIRDITLDGVKIDGGLSTHLEPQYGDDITIAIYNKMHNVGGLVGLLHSDGVIKVEDIVIKSSIVTVDDYYTGEGRVMDTSDPSYIQTFDAVDYRSYEINFISDLMDVWSFQDYSGIDPVWAISNVIGSIAVLSDSASISIKRVELKDSTSIYREAAKGVGGFAGEIAMLSGSLDVKDINLKSNTINLNTTDDSSPSWAVGNFAGAATFGGVSGNYNFENISVNGSIIADYASYSSDFSGFIGHVGALDEEMDADNVINFNNILITGSTLVSGSDVRSIGPFAGSMIGLGDLSGKSFGSNIISMSNILNQFQINTPGMDPILLGGFIGFLGNGDYSISNVVVDADLTVIDPAKFYTKIGQVIGLTSATPKVLNSYYVLNRDDLESGLVDNKNDFEPVLSLKDIDFVANLSKGIW